MSKYKKMNRDERSFTGTYINVEEFKETFGDFEEGDVVILETLDDTIVITIHRKDDNGTLWASTSHNWIIPENQIVAVKIHELPRIIEKMLKDPEVWDGIKLMEEEDGKATD